MNNNREYIYSFPNTSCTLRAIAYLRNNARAYIDSVTVINLVDRWLVRLNIKSSIPYQLVKNLQAFFEEMGSVSQPSAKIRSAIDSLERGESPTEIMNRDRVIVHRIWHNVS